MADIYTYTDATGVITADTGAIQNEVAAEYQSAFGADLNVSPNTPQGLLITLETQGRVAAADNNVALANQINPNLAGGVFLDALLALLGSQRTPATHSSVLCTLTGVVGTSIPAGAQISDSSGNLYQLVSTTVIPTGGTISGVQFQSVLTGPIPGVAGSLTTIVSNILGWETVTNPAAATLGAATQSDAQVRLFRNNTLAAQGTGLAEAITSALFLTNGVISLTFQENISPTTQVINGISMVGHSLYTCVAGTATPLAIATTLTNTKSGGCAYNNGLGIPISQAVVNPFSHQSITVLFDTPSIVNVAIQVKVSAGSSVQNVVANVTNAILNYAAGGLAGQAGFVVGAPVSPFQLASAISAQVPGVFIQEIQVGVQSFTQQGIVTSASNSITGLTYNAPVVVGSNTFQGIQVGMTVTDPLGRLAGGTTVASIVGSNAITISPSAGTFSPTPVTELLTFGQVVSLQTTEIPIGVWQQAATSSGLITVMTV